MSRTSRIMRLPRPSRISAQIAGRLGPPVIDSDLIAEVTARYGIRFTGSPRNLRLARRSLNVAVATPFGARVLKLYRPQWKPATVAYGHSILLHLEEQEVPALRLARACDGATYVTSRDRVLALFDFIPGVNYSLNFLRRRDRLALTVIAGETLARLHRSLEEFVPDGEHHLGFAAHTGPRRRDLAWHAAKLDELHARSGEFVDAEATVRARALVRRSQWLLDEIASLEARLHDADLPRLVIHGDYGLHNLIFQSRGALPVDFEVSRLDWRVNDLVSALGKYRYRGGRYDFQSMRTFVRAYARSFPLTTDERELLPDVWQLYKLQAAVQYWNSYFETDGPTRKLASALDAIEQMQWVAEHADVITALVRPLAPSAPGTRLTVLQVTPNLEIGGAQENLRTMARALPGEGCPTAVCTFDDGPLRGEIEELGIPVELLPARRYSVLALPLFALEMRRLRRRLVELVERYGVDVVQTRGLGTLDFLVATLSSPRSRSRPESQRVQVWWTIENVRFIVRREHLGRYPWLLRPKRAAHRFLYRQGARFVDGIIVVSDETERAFRSAIGYRGDKLHVVPNAVDVDRYTRRADRAQPRAALGFEPEDHVMTMVATFKRQKGHEVLVRALESVTGDVPQLHVLLVGDGELTEEVRAQVHAAGLTRRVHFLGSRRDVPELLAVSDSFVLPSLWEGLPVALVEAMAAGLPVVATSVSGTCQVMLDGVTGWLVPPGDASALAHAVDELLSDPARATAMGAAGRRRVVAQYGAAQQAERLAAQFRRHSTAVHDIVRPNGAIGAVAR